MTALLMTIAITASAMTYTEARREALFLSDKMAYELDLTAPQYEAVYEINLDYLMNLSRHADLFGTAWSHRNTDLMYVLTAMQWERLKALDYFYRPVGWNSGRSAWTFTIYSRYPTRTVMYRSAPVVYKSYRGGYANNYSRSWRNGQRIAATTAPTRTTHVTTVPTRTTRTTTTTTRTTTTTTRTRSTQSLGSVPSRSTNASAAVGTRSFGNGAKRSASASNAPNAAPKTSGGHFGR